MDELLWSTPALSSLDRAILLYTTQSCLSRIIALMFCPFSFVPFLYMLDHLYNDVTTLTLLGLWLVTIHVCLKHTTLGYVEHFHTILMLKQGLSCPCSAINTVPGEDGHWARDGRAEITSLALGPLLSSYSVYKAPWCSEKNGWTAGWGGMWWGRKAFERSVSV